MKINEKDKYLTCQYCKNIFAANKRFTVKKYTQYNMNAKFCSRSCSAKSNKPTHTKESLLEKIRICFEHYKEYCTTEVIINYLGISRKTLTKFGINVININKLYGYTKSNYFETQVMNYLINAYPKYEIIREYSFHNLVHKKQLRVDFYIPELQLVVEADGSQHWDKNSKFYSEEGIIRDNIKTEYFKKNNIKLIRIPYRRKLSKSYFDSFFT